MNRDSNVARCVAAFAGVAFTLLLGAPAHGAAQPAADVPAASATAAPADTPRRGRDRRRAAEAKEPPAAEPVAAAVEASAEPPVEDVGAEIVCKNYKPTGTRMARRVCATAAQWAAVGEATANNASEAMRQIRERSTLAPPVSANPTAPGGN